mmetsp:Transcript_14094/g.38937  ORF Transcript_14094/g.38937 Transcript_14094/m.38937 type:complete len:367 (-) Transcript_14094:12-1112(-)
MFCAAVAVALFANGRWQWGLATALLALILSVCNVAGTIDEFEKHEIRFSVMETVSEIFKVMLRWEAKYLYEIQEKQQQPTVGSAIIQEGRIITLTGLGTLLRRYEESQEKTDASALICQEAVYLAFRRFETDDEVMLAALSLLSIIGKNEKVRQRILLEADTFGLDAPVRAIRKALQRAKTIQDDEAREMQSAEIQRKGFLALGSLADGDGNMARLVVQEGGADSALEAIDWFRCHADVINWALWAMFIVCYEDASNKFVLIQSHGIPKVLQAMRNCPDRLDVCRHGIALLFDWLREDTATCHPTHRLDMWRIRDMARSAGLHDVVLEILEAYSEVPDVVMMGTELLAGTGYQKTELPTVQIEELD